MPWKETCPMSERMKFIVACNESEESFSALCQQFGISRKQGYKWVRRYEEQGPAGLEDKPRVAQHRPHACDEQIVDAVLRLRKEHTRWGPKKLRGYLVQHQPEQQWPAASTIGDWLNKYGQIRPRRRRVRAPVNSLEVKRGEVPNAVWCADFKGNFVLGDGNKCYPLTITDEYSRFLLKCEALLKPRTRPVQEQFEWAFREFGLPKAMRTDNGPPFASVGPGGLTALSVWWIKLEITLLRIEPGQPQQNGRHERMHRTMGDEALTTQQPDVLQQQRALDLFRREYNEVRPHEALGQTPPAQHYIASRRSYPRELLVPQYPDMKVRWTSHQGVISWRRQSVKLGTCLDNEPVGLRQVTQTAWEVYYGPVLLGVLDDRDKEVRLRRASQLDQAILDAGAESE